MPIWITWQYFFFKTLLMNTRRTVRLKGSQVAIPSLVTLKQNIRLKWNCLAFNLILCQINYPNTCSLSSYWVTECRDWNHSKRSLRPQVIFSQFPSMDVDMPIPLEWACQFMKLTTLLVFDVMLTVRCTRIVKCLHLLWHARRDLFTSCTTTKSSTVSRKYTTNEKARKTYHEWF